MFFIAQSFNENMKSLTLEFMRVSKINIRIKKIHIKSVTTEIILEPKCWNFWMLVKKTDYNKSNYVIYDRQLKIKQVANIYFEFEKNPLILSDETHEEDHQPNTSKAVLKQDQLSLESLVRRIYSTLYRSQDDTCQWPRLLTLYKRPFGLNEHQNYMSACGTKLVVNRFINVVKVESFAICCHCILCKSFLRI